MPNKVWAKRGNGHIDLLLVLGLYNILFHTLRGFIAQ